jgi:uncharacterized RDD family membrane protein YckC
MSDNTILDYDDSEGTSPYGHLALASNGSRFVNLILDSIFSIIALYIGLFFGLFILSANLSEENGLNMGEGLAILFSIFCYFGYYIFMEYRFEGRTLGKMITKTRVVTKEGYPISLGQAFGRTFARLIPFDRYSILFNYGSCWHDSLAGTIVVND